LLGREQNTVEINTDGGESRCSCRRFFVAKTSTVGHGRSVPADAHASKPDERSEPNSDRRVKRFEAMTDQLQVIVAPNSRIVSEKESLSYH
jgi:hypothetical protein